MSLEDFPKRLKLFVGKARDVRIFLFDERDEPEDLSAATNARIIVTADEEDTPIISKSASVNQADSSLDVTLTETETANLPDGVVLLQGFVTIGGDEFATKLVYADVGQAAG